MSTVVSGAKGFVSDNVFGARFRNPGGQLQLQL